MSTNMLPKDVERAIARIEAIDRKIGPLEQDMNAMIRTSAVGQPPPVLCRTVDKILGLQNRKAPIWNDIRGRLFGKKTLWQLALEAKLDVAFSGEESYLKITGAEIRALLAREEKETTEPAVQPSFDL